MYVSFFFSSRRRHTRCALVTGVQTCALPILADVIAQEEKVASGPEAAALMRSVVEQFDNYAKLNKKLPAETPVQLSEIDDAARLADAVAANISVKVADKQSLLVESDPVKRLEMVFAFMEGELGVLQVERKIRGRDRKSVV